MIFARPESRGQVALGFCRVVEGANVAAGTQPALPGAVDEYRADLGIAGPRAQQRRHGGGHVERKRVQRLGPVQGQPAQRALLANENVAVLKQSCAHRPTRLLATMTRMISFVPSRI